MRHQRAYKGLNGLMNRNASQTPHKESRHKYDKGDMGGAEGVRPGIGTFMGQLRHRLMNKLRHESVGFESPSLPHKIKIVAVRFH